MWYPADAENLVNEYLDRTSTFLDMCQNWPNEYEQDLFAEIEVFWQFFDLLPCRWCKVDPSDHICYPSDHDGFPSFEVYRGIDIHPKNLNDLIEIPWVLYHLFTTVTYCSDGKKNIRNRKKSEKCARESITQLRILLEILRAAPRPAESQELDPSVDPQSPILKDGGRTIICTRGQFTFTKDQAPIIEIYWTNYKDGNEFLAGQEALERAGRPETTFDSLFKSRRVEFKTVFERHESERDLLRLKLD